MSKEAKRYLDQAEKNLEEVLDFLKKIIEMESPTTNRKAVNRVLKFLVNEIKIFNPAELEVIPSNHKERGDHLLVRFSGKNNSLKPNLIIAHMDTVWDVGTLEKMPYKYDKSDDRLYGPGVFDMKGSIAQTFGALKLLNDNEETPERPLTILFNSDEEINSQTSREIITKEAKKSKQVFILEGGVGDDVLTARKGILYFRVKVKGRSAHAGMDHEKGVNAIEELAHQVIEIQSITDYSKGTTVSAGVINGGTRTNVIPGEAILEVDSRVETMEEQKRVISLIENLKPKLAGVELDIYTLVKRPPLVRSKEIVALYKKAKEIVGDLNVPFEETSTGAISDGNLTAAEGVPTLDGLGLIGEGAHADYENIIKSKIPQRIAILAKLIKEM